MSRMTLPIFAFIVAFCSMSYELNLAQTMTVLYGHTVFNYTLVIGIFIFSLGIGASWWAFGLPKSFYCKTVTGSSFRAFIIIELILALLGLLSPLVIFGTEIAGAGYDVDLVTPVSCLLAFFIGVFSGMEIPILIEVSKESGDTKSVGVIVGVDFLGTFAAAVLVPILIFPTMGMIATAFATALINIVLAIFLVAKKYPGWKLTMAIGMMFFVSLFLLIRAADVSDWIFSRVF